MEISTGTLSLPACRIPEDVLALVLEIAVGGYEATVEAARLRRTSRSFANIVARIGKSFNYDRAGFDVSAAQNPTWARWVLKTFPLLHVLQLNGADMCDEGMLELASHLPHLTHLELFIERGCTDEAVEKFAKLCPLLQVSGTSKTRLRSLFDHHYHYHRPCSFLS